MQSDNSTSYESKKVMMRAEHSDEIEVETLGVCEVVRRNLTYYGPKLRIEPLEDGADQYILHAPGPNGELQLLDTAGTPLRRVGAELVSTKQYDICLRCGEPLKGAEHRRLAAVGACTIQTDGGTDTKED